MGISAKRRLRSQGVASSPVIIQCPACSTKFALDAKSISDIPEPRFHCSRCDHVFTATDTRRAAAEKIMTESPVERIRPALREVTSQPSIIRERLQPEPAAPRPSLGIPESLSRDFSPQAPHENALEPAGAQLEITFSSVPEEPAPHSVEPPELPPFEIPNATALPVEEFNAPDPVVEAATHADQDLEPRPARDFEPNFPVPGSPATETRSRLSWIPRSPGFGSLAVCLVGCLGILAILAVALRGNVETAAALSRVFIPGAPRLAPPEVSLKGLKFRKITLESGETVGVISGRLVNGSTESFREVEIEGIIFDRRGSIINSTRTSASSGLVRSRLRSLPPEVIESTQRQAAPGGWSLDPEASHEILVVLNHGNPLEGLHRAHSFTARVTSVKSR